MFSIASFVGIVDLNRSVKDAVLARLRRQTARQRISVTDLVSLKQAYFRRKHPEIVPPLEKQQLMWAGTGFHELFGARVSRDEYLEQFVEVDGVVGKIDIYEDIPTEIKTTSNIPEDSDLVRKRPSYLEQLGFYCAMVGVTSGRVVIYQRGAKTEQPLAAFRVRFSSIAAILEDMRVRRELLQRALDDGDPSQLPKCPWLYPHCDYAVVCDCKTSLVQGSRVTLEQVVEVKADEAATQELIGKLREERASEGRVRFNDLVFPRKTFLARLKAENAIDDQDTEDEERLISMEKRGFLGVVREAVKYGAPGKSQHVPVKFEKLEDVVLMNDGIPTVVRSSKLRNVVERSSVGRMFSHYLERLGFECAMTDRNRGRLVLFYENVEREDAKLIVYDIGFKNIEALKTEVLNRIHLLDTAEGLGDLPACPDWMCRYCNDASTCGAQASPASRRVPL